MHFIIPLSTAQPALRMTLLGCLILEELERMISTLN